MAHEGDDSGADPKFVGGDGLEDAPSLKLGTVSPQLPPPQSGSETVGGTDQQQRQKRKNRGIRETGQPAENKGMSKDALYRANRKVAQQKVEEEKNDLKAKNEELEGENMQLKWEKFGLEKQVLELKAVAEKEKAVAEKEKAVAEKEKAVAEKEKAEKRYIQRELEITTQKLQTQTEELNSLKREHEITAQNLQTQTEELNSLKKSYDWLTTGSLSQRTSVSPPKLAQVWATWSKRMVTFLINTSTKLPSLPVDSQTTDGPDSPPASGGREMGTESVPGVGGTLTECLGASSSPPLASGDESRAAVRIQQVYRSYRTRRRLADSAVVAEKLCWRARDFARLNRSTISFFNFLKPETATSGCNRITLNASKVGKRLCRDAKAQQLAFRHWIEAIDARHRYGHNLQTYFLEWYKNDAGQPFFYWLDVGAGKELDLKKCPRSKLRQQRIKYLGPREREHYEYIVAEGQIKHKQTEELLDTINVSKEGKWIFIMSTSKRLYAAEKKKGLFHHSSFLAGGATLAAGRLEAEKGILRSISAYGGHYKPGGLDNFLSFLKEKGVNINEVKICKLTDDSNSYCDGKSNGLGVSSEVLTNSDLHEPEMPTEEKTTPPDSLENDQTETRTTYKRTLSGLKSPRAKVPKTSIMKRINSKEVAKSYQLGHQLSRKWTSGAGPRIGCVANYPLELREQALEFVNLL